MKNSIRIVLTVLLLATANSVSSQVNVTPPSEGKAVIYFLRTTNLGALMNIRYFDNNQYIGKFSGMNFYRYECEPGKRIFWFKAENIDFVEAELEEGKVYLLETNPVIGGFSAGVKAKLVDTADEKQMKRVNKLLEKKETKSFTSEELAEGQDKNNGVIQRGMLKINKKRGKKKNLKVLQADSYIAIK